MSEAAALRALLYHVTLPPRLPGREDDGSLQPAIIAALFQQLRSAAQGIQQSLQLNSSQDWEPVLASLSSSQSVLLGRAIHTDKLRQALQTIQPKCPVTVHIEEQNAGLLIWRHLRYPNTFLFFPEIF